ncbi:MAG: response regulator transcription factor [Terriglobia bacterium]|nr:response regulator transcription factor [Terriglobia bacterium]
MKQLRLALADDNPEILEMVSDLLGDEFSIVGLFADGKSVLQHNETVKPDVIILDVSLGDSNGFDVARMLREGGSTAQILFLTVYEDEEFVKASFEAGGTAYVIKRRLRSDLIPALHAVANHQVFISDITE